ncbi:MAG TPA: PKD domain-containing protein [Phycisphaerales bacterium]|nr:PKD domain-containing protein [Phycisphaerales bacterium]HMP37895.1 PKD domain-containing protein [Phycisphaerales bacterium]
MQIRAFPRSSAAPRTRSCCGQRFGVPALAPILGTLGAVLSALAIAPAVEASCQAPKPPTFTVTLPKVVNPPNPQGWNLPTVWGPLNAQVPAADSIVVPNGRPIYALFVSGFRSNGHLDQLMTYSFARHLMAQGAYVHYAWWNNLLAPYMERPLHHAQSHPGLVEDLLEFSTPQSAEQKAVPGENHQFLADAKLFLSAIRANNPEAVIVIVGHSMGGHTVAQLANETDVLIDLVAPIDPVGCRTYPWAPPAFQSEPHFNWTRYRATRENFLGYRSMTWVGGVFGACEPDGPWLQTWGEASQGSTHPLCLGQVHVHGAPRMTFGSNVINLYHRWQEEFLYPFDYADVRLFNPSFPFPAGGSQVQTKVTTQDSGGESGGWPQSALPLQGCCPASNGVGWPKDGHGEIVGARGPVLAVVPLAYRVRTSPECGVLCSGLTWPARTYSGGAWGNPSSAVRVALLKALETTPLNQSWAHQPYNPALCKVSGGLISRFESINKPPVADAGGDQSLFCAGCQTLNVMLDGSGSSDPEGQPLSYAWNWGFGSASGAVVTVPMPVGTHCVKLDVTDSVGHVKRDTATITVIDTTSPLHPYTGVAHLWKQAAGQWAGMAFDQPFPGIPNATGCLLASPNAPAVVALPGGVLTVTATQNGAPTCAVTDASTAPAVSDAVILSANATVTYEFDPAIAAFYTYFGSLAIGHTASMKVFGAESALLGTITTPPSGVNALATGQGFTSTVPVHRIEFTATEPGTVLIGAFVGLRSGEPSLGSVDLGSYQGPAGGIVQLDFAVAFHGACYGDLDGDGYVDAADLGVLLAAWGFCDGCPADLDGSGSVDAADLGILLGAWGRCE